MGLLALLATVAGVPAAVKSSFFCAIGAPGRFFSLSSCVFDSTLLLVLALLADLHDDPVLLLLECVLKILHFVVCGRSVESLENKSRSIDSP